MFGILGNYLPQMNVMPCERKMLVAMAAGMLMKASGTDRYFPGFANEFGHHLLAGAAVDVGCRGVVMDMELLTTMGMSSFGAVAMGQNPRMVVKVLG